MIELKNITKTFNFRGQKTKAVDDLSLFVPEGEIVALVGPNGAGKTTVLRILTTLARPDKGQVSINGFEVQRNANKARAQLGYMPQKGALLAESRIQDELVFQGALFDMPTSAAKIKAKELLYMFELDDARDRQAQQLSGGQRRRIDIALSLMHTPRVLLLDEPTTGLDPQSRANLWTHIKKLRAELNVTILLTTHYLEEAEHLADRIAVIDQGKIVADNSPGQLITEFAQDTVIVGTATQALANEAARVLQPQFAGNVDKTDVVLRIPHAATAAPEIMSVLQAANISLNRLEVNRASLDDVFFNLTGRALRD